MKLKRIGVDLAKSVFQVHGVDSHEQVQVSPSLPNFCRFPDMAPRSRWKPAWLLGVADQIEM